MAFWPRVFEEQGRCDLEQGVSGGGAAQMLPGFSSEKKGELGQGW